MQNQIVYTIGTIIALFLLLLFLRAVFTRRARHSEILANGRYDFVVVGGGGWSDGGIGAMGRGRGGAYVLPTDVRRPEPAARINRGGNRDRNGEELVDELPRYEAPPPEYETVVKETARAQQQQPSPAAAAVEGEPSSGAPPGGSGDIEMGNVPPAPSEPVPGVGERVRSVLGRLSAR